MSFRQGILWSFTAVLAAVYPGVAVAQLAPQSQEEFEQRFTGWTLQFDAPDCNEGDGVDPITFIEPGRFEISGLEGDYEYEETGANTGTLTVTADILPIPQVLDLTFNSQTMGSFTVAVFGVVVCEGSFEFVESMTVAPPPPTGEGTSPPNDLFSNAQTISGPSGRATGSNVGATVEPGEPGSGSSSVWWQWRAPSSGRVTIDTSGSSFDTILGVYTGTRVDTLTTLGENDDAVGFGGASRVTLTVTAGTVYMLRVSGFGGREGSIVLNWNLTESPPPTGGPTYYFPHLAVGASWQTTITYINYSSEEVTCQTDFLSDQGTPLLVSFADRGTVDSRNDVLPPGGSVHQETNVELSAPLAPGWARATCTGPVKASLLFRGYDSEGAPLAEAGVNAATVPATRFVTFAEQGEGKSGTGVAYANPSDTEAAVTFTARDAAGQMLASVSQELPAGGHGAQNMALLFGLTGFTGSLEVTSTEPIVTLSLNFEAAPVFSSLPPGELDAAAQGSTTYYFPHLAVGNNWQTTITYINDSPQEVSCQTEFISDFGNPLMVSFAGRGTVVSRNDVLPPGGSVHQETNVDLSAPLAPGWARATCTGPVKASLLFRGYDSEGAPVAEGGVNAATVAATRFVTFAEQGEGKSGTGVAYANPSDTAAVITFTAKDEAGETLASVVRTLSPGGHDAQNMAHLFGLSSFTGSLEVTSTEPIVTLSLNFEAAPVFSSLPPGEVDASDKPFNQQQTERLTGTWVFSYTIGSSEFTETYRLSDVEESPTMPGEWNISGTDQYGGLVIAGYSPSLGMFSLLDEGITIDRFFTFDFVGSNTVSGCFYLVYKDDDSLSRCYDMTGVRTSSSTLSSLKRAQPNTTAAQAELAEIEEANKLGIEMQMEVDPRMNRTLEDLREVLR